MGFSESVKIECLIKCARHCCSCHRYCGVGVEVHHLIPQAAGGNDDFDNAIPLCYDCHANAGHYNPKHPRGLKYSVKELRRARDEWYKTVEENKINTPAQVALELSIKHIKTECWEILSEIVSGEYRGLPEENILLFKNQTYELFNDLVGQYSGNRALVDHTTEFMTIAELFQQRPDVKGLKNEEIDERDKGKTRPFRDVNEADIKNVKDPLVQMLYKAGVPAQMLIDVDYEWNFCGATGPVNLIETISTKRLSFAFLLIKNISDKVINPQSYIGQTLAKPFEFFNLTDASDIDGEIVELPKLTIEPGQSLVIPQFVGLGMAGFERRASTQLEDKPVDGEFWGYHQTIHYVNDSSDPLNAIQFGPQNIVKSFEYSPAGEIGKNIRIHDFSHKNLFQIDRQWECGSCPYIFCQSAKGEWSYLGETAYHLTPRVYQHSLPANCKTILVAELEEETAVIEHLIVKNSEGLVIYKQESLILVKGQRQCINLEEPLEEGSFLEVRGYHKPKFSVELDENKIFFKREIVKEFYENLKENLGSF
tara:strand:- start:7004 stop:8614 length:1611 start_codon:yes stop_codon:yes gene_type:complete